ncbi:MAG: hypothetical protein H6Q90_6907 [Deltaproteobacteria bacterium]|nr:hypothetical protein [Deltaproteobacteria bacterium]
MHHELMPAIHPSPPGAELTRFAGRVLLAVTLDIAILGFVGTWFWFGLKLST